MSTVTFDPYQHWLGIPAHEQPPHFYRLLGLAPFEPDVNVIVGAADQWLAYLAQYAQTEYAPYAQKVYEEIAHVRMYLADPNQKAQYDAWLQQVFAAQQASQNPQTYTQAAQTYGQSYGAPAADPYAGQANYAGQQNYAAQVPGQPGDPYAAEATPYQPSTIGYGQQGYAGQTAIHGQPSPSGMYGQPQAYAQPAAPAAPAPLFSDSMPVRDKSNFNTIIIGVGTVAVFCGVLYLVFSGSEPPKTTRIVAERPAETVKPAPVAQVQPTKRQDLTELVPPEQRVPVNPLAPVSKPEPTVEEAPVEPTPEPTKPTLNPIPKPTPTEEPAPEETAMSRPVPKPTPDPEAMPAKPKPNPENPAPEATTEAMPKPTPMPPPGLDAINPTPEVAVPTGPAPVEASPGQESAWKAAVKGVRNALLEREFDDAATQLAVAQRMAVTEPQKEETDRLDQLVKHVGTFWKAVRQGMANMTSGQEFEVKGRVVVVVEISENLLVLRDSGQNKRFTLRTLPTSLAMMFADSWFKDVPSTKIYIGSYHAMDGLGDRLQARALWDQAARSGDRAVTDMAKQLLPELD